MNRRAAAAVAVALALMLAAWWLFSAPAELPAQAPATLPGPVAATPAGTPSRSAGTTSVAPTLAAAGPLPAEPLPLAPSPKQVRWLSEVYDELLQRAEAGDVAAMLELGHRLLPCSDNGLAGQRRQLRIDGQFLHDDGDELKPAARSNVQRQIDTALRALAECEALPPSQRSRGADWMEKAAASGWGKAQLDYVQFALGEFRVLDENEAITQVEEFLRRRELAQRFMAAAMTHCVPEALNVQTFAAGLLFGGDDARNAAINRAAAADAAAREGSASGAQAAYVDGRQRDFDYFLSGFDEAARAEARRRGEAMFTICVRR